MLKLLRQFLQRKPFAPFRIVLQSGERHGITDPEKVAVGSTKVFVISPVTGRLTEIAVRNIELIYTPRRR